MGMGVGPTYETKGVRLKHIFISHNRKDHPNRSSKSDVCTTSQPLHRLGRKRKYDSPLVGHLSIKLSLLINIVISSCPAANIEEFQLHSAGAGRLGQVAR